MKCIACSSYSIVCVCRLSKRMQAACLRPVNSVCVVLGGWSNFGLAVDKLLLVPLAAVVLFSGHPNVRYIGKDDEIALSKYFGWHEEVFVVVLANVSVSCEFLGESFYRSYGNIHSVRLCECMVRICGKFGNKVGCVWEIFVENECMVVFDEIGGDVPNFVRRIADKYVESISAEMKIWLKWFLGVLDVGFVKDKRALHRYFRFSVDGFSDIPFHYFKTKQIVVDSLPLYVVGFIVKYVQCFSSSGVLRFGVPVPGKMYRV